MYIESESNQSYREGDSVYEKIYLFNVKSKNKNKQFWTTTSAVSAAGRSTSSKRVHGAGHKVENVP